MSKPRKVGIVRLSALSGDFSKPVQDYLDSIGHSQRFIGITPVFVRYEKGRAAAVGPTRESVELVEVPKSAPLGRIIQDLTSIERMALRAFIDHGQIPKLTVLRRLVYLRLVTPGPYFELHAGVKDEVAEYEADKKRVHVLNPEQIATALKARKEPPIQ